MSKVKFTAMKDGSKEDYLLLDKHEQTYINHDKWMSAHNTLATACYRAVDKEG